MKSYLIGLAIAVLHALLTLFAWGQGEAARVGANALFWSRITETLSYPILMLNQQPVFNWIPFSLLFIANSLIWGFVILAALSGVRVLRAKWARHERTTSG
jgi:hypothetical protein